jgi:hypothetical protein
MGGRTGLAGIVMAPDRNGNGGEDHSVGGVFGAGETSRSMRYCAEALPHYKADSARRSAGYGRSRSRWQGGFRAMPFVT